MSFVIPAFNEQGLIARTIQAIHASVSDHSLYEIVVVDNASSDATAHIAATQGATVVTQGTGTIGSLRNTGVRHTKGGLLVFLDADVVLTQDWSARIPSVIELMTRHGDVITGSICSIPENAGWIERFWFEPRSGRYSSHIGTGHMIMTRDLFTALGGFDESLATGEDYDLSLRAGAKGARIVLDEKLKVEHMGFPRTLRAFVSREIWHGRSDYRSLRALLTSKVAVASVLFALLHLAVVLGLLSANVSVTALSAAAIVGLCIVSSFNKYRDQPFYVVIVNSALFYFYYLGRALSAMLRTPGSGARQRQSPQP